MKKNSKNGDKVAKVTRTNTGMRVVKVMSVFTGVETVGIVCSAIRLKLAALWLEAAGLGLFNIFNNTIETASYLTSLGLRQSAVRDVSLAAGEGESRLKKVISLVRSWSVVAGLLGCAVLSVAAWPLAEIIFQDGEMWWNFMILGGTMLLNALYSGEAAIFQGTEAFKRMAQTGLWGAVGGLAISIPMYRYLGYVSVPLSIFAYSLAGVVAAFFQRDKRYNKAAPSRKMLHEEKQFVKLGAWLSLTGFISSFCQLIFASWLNHEATLAEVGLYGAGMTLVVRYTSLVFNSVGLEFYPRISANLQNTMRMEIFLNHEITLLLLLFTPLVLLFLIFREVIVRILYTPEFMAVIPFITLAILVVIFRAVSNTSAYLILAKGEGKIYLITESLDAIMGLMLSMFLYKQLGLAGLGLAMIIWHLIYMLVTTEICRRRYGIMLSRGAGKRAMESLIVVSAVIGSTFWLPGYVWIPVSLIIAVIYIVKFYQFLSRRRKSRTPLSQ